MSNAALTIDQWLKAVLVGSSDLAPNVPALEFLDLLIDLGLIGIKFQVAEQTPKNASGLLTNPTDAYILVKSLVVINEATVLSPSINAKVEPHPVPGLLHRSWV